MQSMRGVGQTKGHGLDMSKQCPTMKDKPKRMGLSSCGLNLRVSNSQPGNTEQVTSTTGNSAVVSDTLAYFLI